MTWTAGQLAAIETCVRRHREAEATRLAMEELVAVGQLDPRDPRLQVQVERDLRWQLEGYARTFRTPIATSIAAKHGRTAVLQAYQLAACRLLAEEQGKGFVRRHLAEVVQRLDNWLRRFA